jgi:hypothetical protein
LFILFIILCSCCKFDNRKTRICDTKDTTVFYVAVDTLPSFKYAKLDRKLQPAKQIINGKLQISRDSLLSVYLEDNVYFPNYCEGIFQYTILLYINETGKVDKVTFNENRYNSEILQKLVTEALKKIQFKPAVKNNKNVSINITVNVLIDLYNYPSKIRQALLKE